MTRGTKSLLFGVHCFWFHPWCVALAWWRLFGFPWDPRLWVAFIIHDWGYFGKKAMDDEDGESHPELGAEIMGRLFGNEWAFFCLLHSRYYAKSINAEVSKLCYADKLSVIYVPDWLYVLQGTLSGEIWEYLEISKSDTYNPYKWIRRYKQWAVRWVIDCLSESPTDVFAPRTAISKDEC